MAFRFADPPAPRRWPGAVFSPVSGPSPALVAGVTVVAIVAACFVGPDEAEHGPVLCPFRRVTGLPCPGCGLTRSWVDLLHGDLAAAMTANPFGIVALVCGLLVVGGVAVALVRRRPIPSYDEIFGSRAPATTRRRLGMALAVLWIGFGAVRLALSALG